MAKSILNVYTEKRIGEKVWTFKPLMLLLEAAIIKLVLVDSFSLLCRALYNIVT